MKVIHKYNLNIGITRLLLPKDAIILKCGVQKDEPVLWALVDVDPSNPINPDIHAKMFRVYATGEPLVDFEDYDLVQEYIDTFQLQAGHFVGHVFEIKNVEKQ